MSVDLSEYKKHSSQNIKDTWVTKKPPKDYQQPSSWKKDSPFNPDLYTYKDSINDVCFYITRKTDGFKKSFNPLSYVENDKGQSKWSPVAWAKDRPLFNEHLINKTSKPILIVEGEKTANYANKDDYYKNKYLAVTWSGGSKAAHKTKFDALKDRQVILLPDNDEAGCKAMQYVAKTLIENDITDKILWAEFDTDKVSEGWDIADGPPKNDSFENFIKNTEYQPIKKIWKELDQEEANRETKNVLADLQNKYVYVHSLDSFFDLAIHAWREAKQLNNYYKHVTKRENISSQLLQHKDTIKVESYFTHAGKKPGVNNLKDREVYPLPVGKYLNIFRPNTVVADTTHSKVMQRVDEYYEWLLGKECWNTVKQFIAFLVQCPGEKITWVIVLISKTEGVGKQLLMFLISAALGDHNVEENVSCHELTEKHSSLIEGKQVICLNELSITNSGKDKQIVTEELKRLFTDDKKVINKKNKDPITIPNRCNFFIFSNDERCLKLENETRRYYINKIRRKPDEVKKKLEDEKYKDDILDAAKLYPGQVLYFFQNIKIENKQRFFSSAPRTKDLEQMIEDSKPELHKWLDLLLKECKSPFHKSRIIQSAFGLYTELNNQIPKPVKYMTIDLVTDWLINNCIPWKPGQNTRQIQIGSGRSRYYLIKDDEVESAKNLTEKEIADWLFPPKKEHM